MPDDPDSAPTRPSAEDLTIPEAPSKQRALWSATPERYRLGSELGRGGMGEVFGATDEAIGREVAIKRLLAGHGGADVEARFIREGKIQGRLDHPSIPPVYELGYDRDGRPYIVMKRLTGTTLADLLARAEAGGPAISRERLLRAFVDVCLAVELAHNRGVVHRDLKPANIMLGDLGEVYVLDWGVAKLVGDTSTDGALVRAATDGDNTVAGQVIGTPAYMAPEQREARADVDGRADVFALGRVLAEILAGRRLRASEHNLAAAAARAADLPPELDQLCEAATAADREARIPRARDLADRVQGYLDGDRDLGLRRELARGHLRRALACAEIGAGVEAERVAIREASRALALDPTYVAAADLVGRLMLAPASELPREVVDALASATRSTDDHHARFASLAYLLYVALVPVGLLVGVRSVPHLVAIAVVGPALTINARWSTRSRWRHAMAMRRYGSIIGSAVAIAVVARMFTTFLIAPALAALHALIMTRNSAFRGRWAPITAVGLALGVFVPWLGELLGVIEPTTRFADGNLVLHSPVMAMTETPTLCGLAAYLVISITIAMVISHVHARAQRTADEKLQLQAWRLKQLMPTAAGAEPAAIATD